MKWQGLAFGLAIWLLLPCAETAGEGRPAPARRDNPLADHIWDVSAAHEVSRAELLTRLSRATVVLLGETHDNAVRHRLQGEIFAALSAGDARPVLVTEQFDIGRLTFREEWSAEM